MTHWRELVATILAVAVMAVTKGDLSLGLITWFAVWLVLTPNDSPDSQARDDDWRNHDGS